jgi:hypothetical protein
MAEVIVISCDNGKESNCAPEGEEGGAGFGEGEGDAGNLRARRARRGVRLRSVPQEEFLLPPLYAEAVGDGGPDDSDLLGADLGGGASESSSLPISPRSIALGVVSAFSLVRKVSQRVSSGKKQGRKMTHSAQAAKLRSLALLYVCVFPLSLSLPSTAHFAWRGISQ